MASTKTTNAVINYLLSYGSSPRIDIAKALSLTKASVTLVTNVMLEKGIIIEQGEIFEENKKTIRGRRKILLSINPDYKVTVGVVILQDKIVIGITNLKGDVFVKNSILFTFNSQDELVGKIAFELDLLLKNNLIDINNVLACGVVVSKNVMQTIVGETLEIKMDGLKNAISDAVPYNVVIDTMAKSCLISQRVFGKSINAESCMMISLVENVEVGLCINKSLYLGKNNCAGGSEIINKALEKYKIDNDLLDFTKTLSMCLSVLDIHHVYGLGDIFSDNMVLSRINDGLGDDLCIGQPVVQENSLFIAGCGQALYKCLVS